MSGERAPEGCHGCGHPLPDRDTPELAGWKLDDRGTAICPACLSSGESADEQDEQEAAEARRASATEADGTDASWPVGDG